MFQNGTFGTTGPEMWLPGSAFENELGVQAPVGFWDPMGFCKDGDVEDFKRRRETELKHGRVSMFAAMGYITPEYFKFPGYLSPSAGLKFEDVPNGLGAIGKVPVEGWLQWVALCGFYEIVVNKPNESEPGNYGRGWLGITGSSVEDPAKRTRALNSELANGRLAMVAIMGMMFQNGTFGTTGPEMWLPGSAFENELGVQAPVGFWDPAGFTSDGDQIDFYRRRKIELKHGRVSMLACLGYIVPEFVKFPGYLSPSTGLKFADVPTGLAATTKVPAVGWAQYTIFCGICELFLLHQDPDKPPGKLETRFFGEENTNYEYGSLGIPGYLGGAPIADPEIKKKKLNAELANGRLAMMAIIGMFFQDGLTGSARGDWALYTASPLRA